MAGLALGTVGIEEGLAVNSEFHHGPAAEFLGLPYGQRQLITIVSNEAALAERQARSASPQGNWVEEAGKRLAALLATAGQVAPAVVVAVALEV